MVEKFEDEFIVIRRLPKYVFIPKMKLKTHGAHKYKFEGH